MNLMQLEVHIDQELSKNPTLEYVVDTASNPDEHTKNDARIFIGENENLEVRIGKLVRRLKVREEYLQRTESKSTTLAERDVIQSAQWLVESIQHRSVTLKKVVSTIAQHQLNYIKSGDILDIGKLNMVSIAEAVGVHATTVSRAIHAKSIETPHGVVRLCDFFGGNIKETEDAIGIREAIRKAVDEEDKSAPLEDQQLVDFLKIKGFNVARRTVTKYRKIMNIPSSRQRRKWNPDQEPSDSE